MTDAWQFLKASDWPYHCLHQEAQPQVNPSMKILVKLLIVMALQ